MGLLISEDKQNVLLIHKNRPDWQVGRLNGIGGKIEESDLTSVDAMIREFREEASLEIKQWLPVVTITGEIYSVEFFYTIDDRIYEAESLTDEKIEIFNIYSLPDVIFNLRWIIPMCIDDNISKPVILLDS